MKIGIAISDEDVSEMNSFIFQVVRQANADIMLSNGGIPGLLEKNRQNMVRRDLVDFSVTTVPIITSGQTSRKLQRSEYESTAKKLKSLRIDMSVMAGGDGSLQFLNTPSGLETNYSDVGMIIDNDVYGSNYTVGFSTACKQTIKEVSRLRNIGRALLGWVFTVEVLGGHCGELALQSVIKCSANTALIPKAQIPLAVLAEQVTRESSM